MYQLHQAEASVSVETAECNYGMVNLLTLVGILAMGLQLLTLIIGAADDKSFLRTWDESGGSVFSFGGASKSINLTVVSWLAVTV